MLAGSFVRKTLYGDSKVSVGNTWLKNSWNMFELIILWRLCYWHCSLILKDVINLSLVFYCMKQAEAWFVFGYFKWQLFNIHQVITVWSIKANHVELLTGKFHRALNFIHSLRSGNLDLNFKWLLIWVSATLQHSIWNFMISLAQVSRDYSPYLFNLTFASMISLYFLLIFINGFMKPFALLRITR